MNIEKLFELADRAKSIRDYTLANVIFGTVLEVAYMEAMPYMEAAAHRADVNCGLDFRIELETEDEQGFNLPQSYYDLVTIVAERDGKEVGRMCIPVPLLSTVTAVSVAKFAAITERRPHKRDSAEGSIKDSALLWKEFESTWDMRRVAKGLLHLNLRHVGEHSIPSSLLKEFRSISGCYL